jgi:hypothetical protein
MPLMLPDETGVEVGNLNVANGLANQGHEDDSQVKGKGKRLERSKSRVMTNIICACCGQSTFRLNVKNFSIVLLPWLWRQ